MALHDRPQHAPDQHPARTRRGAGASPAGDWEPVDLHEVDLDAIVALESDGPALMAALEQLPRGNGTP